MNIALTPPSSAADAGRLQQSGLDALARGAPVEAAACFTEALAGQPESAELRCHLGLACFLQERYQEAVLCCREALRFQPEYPEAAHLLGLAMERLGRADAAESCYRQALAWRPDFPEVHFQLGLLRQNAGDLAAAEAHYGDALRTRPAYADAWSNLSAVLIERDRPREALAAAEQALDGRPAGGVAAWCNLGLALKLERRYFEALAAYREALRLAPEDPKVRWNYALALLGVGHWEQGWEEYEWRFRAGITPAAEFTEPQWDGSSLDGKTILVVAEQGLGDSIQFLRYLPLLKARGARVVFEAQPRLAPLLEGHPAIDVLVPRGASLPRFDCYAHLLGLPRLFGTRPDSIPAAVPYVFVPDDLRERCRDRIAAWPGRKIGLCWAGNSQNLNDRLRSLPAVMLEPLVAFSGATFFSLQRPAPPPGVLERLVHIEEDSGSLADTAALIASLDLVISVDTMPLHLAGALGTPAWALLASVPDWRWMAATSADGTRTPWYPALRMFRQSAPGDWAGVVRSVVEELGAL